MNPKVSIIILNWNSWKDTTECLDSLYKINYPNYDIIIVDNNSSDNSIGKLKDYCNNSFLKWDSLENHNKQIKYTKKELKMINSKNIPQFSESKIILIKNDENHGFAEGNNIGIRYALKNFNPDYILLLNNDTIVEKNFLDELLKVAKSDESIGSVQSLLLKPGGKIIDSLGQELSLWSARDIGIDSEYNVLNENREIFGACAAAALYNCKTLKITGLFDKDFFIISEDTDLSWRIRLNGFKSILSVNSVVYHKRNISKEASKLKLSELLRSDSGRYHGTKNMLIIAIRYHPLSSMLNIKYLYKSILTLFACIYFSLKIKRIHETLRLIFKNLEIRRDLKRNPLLQELQNEWINNTAD